MLGKGLGRKLSFGGQLDLEESERDQFCQKAVGTAYYADYSKVRSPVSHSCRNLGRFSHY